MPHFVQGVVRQILEERPGLQKIRIERDDKGQGDRAYVLTQLVGPVNVGDQVVLNVTAVDLNLGTGGWHFVHWNLANHEFHQVGPGHVMKLRYTSLQVDSGTIEEHGFQAPDTLSSTPVVACMLLSQVAAVAAAVKFVHSEARIVLVVHDQNALPIALSDLVHELKQTHLLDATVTTGQSFGGDYEAVNIMSGYGVAKGLAKADVIIVSNGHGSVGTGTPTGFSALPLAGALDDAFIYGGSPIMSLRWSDADPRERHQGLSHHAQTVMDRAESLLIAVPTGANVAHPRHQVEAVDVPDIGELFAKWGVNVTTMGRSYDEDPQFFQYAGAAGIVAAQGLH